MNSACGSRKVSFITNPTIYDSHEYPRPRKRMHRAISLVIKSDRDRSRLKRFPLRARGPSNKFYRHAWKDRTDRPPRGLPALRPRKGRIFRQDRGVPADESLWLSTARQRNAVQKRRYIRGGRGPRIFRQRRTLPIETLPRWMRSPTEVNDPRSLRESHVCQNLSSFAERSTFSRFGRREPIRPIAETDASCFRREGQKSPRYAPRASIDRQSGEIKFATRDRRAKAAPSSGEGERRERADFGSTRCGPEGGGGRTARGGLIARGRRKCRRLARLRRGRPTDFGMVPREGVGRRRKGGSVSAREGGTKRGC